MLSVIMLSVVFHCTVMLNVIMLSVILPSVIMLSAVMLNVVTPFFMNFHFSSKDYFLIHKI